MEGLKIPRMADADPYSRQWKIVYLGVLGVLGAIAALLALGFWISWKARPGADLTNCKSRLSDLSTALERYSTDSGGRYPTSLGAIVPKYINRIPECPAAGRPTYQARFGPGAPLNSDGLHQYYYLECAGGNHTRASIQGNYPAYNGTQGLIMPAGHGARF